MKTAFTPGPWEVIAACEHHGAYVTSPWGTTLADLYNMSNPSDLSVRNGGSSKPIPFVDSEANAHLIAAAPELYQALEALCELADGLGEHLEFDAACENARAALAKARGEQ